MRKLSFIEFREGSKEELLPNMENEFPFISSYVEFNNYTRKFVPWHWHKEIELFYIEKGELEYYTPQGKIIFKEGSGGIINSNVLHMTKTKDKIENTIQLLHIFDTTFLSGHQGSRIDKKYIIPFITASKIEIIPFFKSNSQHVKILKLLLESFKLSNEEFVYEIKIRSILCEIWEQILNISKEALKVKSYNNKRSNKLKMMMIYIHEHYSEKISILEISQSAFISERECFRIFQEYLHITPVQYLKDYRIQKACDMLKNRNYSITHIAQECGLGSSSYFGKIFRKQVGCTPLKYRQGWQNNNIFRQK